MAHPTPSVPKTPGESRPSIRDALPVLLLLTTLWGWSLHINSAFWLTNPNYHHGWLVPILVVFFLWRRLQTQSTAFWNQSSFHPLSTPVSRSRRLKLGLPLALPALAVFPLEVLRTEYHQSGIVLWAINGATVAVTLATARGSEAGH